jgi:dienelactone hydrolase
MGAGPPVIIIREVPGITPLVAKFARRVADRVMTSVPPDLLATPAKSVTIPYAISSMVRAGVSKEFAWPALDETSPIVDFL